MPSARSWHSAKPPAPGHNRLDHTLTPHATHTHRSLAPPPQHCRICTPRRPASAPRSLLPLAGRRAAAGPPSQPRSSPSTRLHVAGPPPPPATPDLWAGRRAAAGPPPLPCIPGHTRAARRAPRRRPHRKFLPGAAAPATPPELPGRTRAVSHAGGSTPSGSRRFASTPTPLHLFYFLFLSID
ncbi:hypothetical protein PVAP13_9KG249413 [Panicum virgatum]|uniref:Uncharacterized protein n=1 Tax=Panicum virgatum TaxID=38727 RepID=A0A8T0NMU0_PANVG|nr:hypothetical protein PVAP13_9KG249413 [Panicum virgatum]